MLKVKPPEGYPPEPGRYARGNDYSPVAVCVILDEWDFSIPADLQELMVAGVDSGAAISGMLQTENIGMEKLLCNVAANPNIRHIVLCGRESAGHMPGEALLLVKENGVDEKRQIIGSTAPTPTLANIPLEVIERFRKQVVTIVNLLCRPGVRDTSLPGLDPKVVTKAVWSCYQESPVEFNGYSLYDMGAYPEPPIVHNIVADLLQPRPSMEPGKAGLSAGLTLQKFLPKTNCKECGRRNCLAFAIDLAKGKATLDQCPPLSLPEYNADRHALTKLLQGA